MERNDGGAFPADPRPATERRRVVAGGLAFDKLAEDDGTLLRLALSNVQKWEDAETCSAYYVHEWRRVLSLPLADARACVLADTDAAAAMRQNNPFAGFFSNAERRKLRAVP